MRLFQTRAQVQPTEALRVTERTPVSGIFVTAASTTTFSIEVRPAPSAQHEGAPRALNDESYWYEDITVTGGTPWSWEPANAAGLQSLEPGDTVFVSSASGQANVRMFGG